MATDTTDGPRPLYRPWVKWLVSIILLTLSGLVLWNTWSGYTARREVEAVARKLQPPLAGDPRFAEVKVRRTTAGIVFIHGTVVSDADRDALQDLVQTTTSSHRVQLHVTVKP